MSRVDALVIGPALAFGALFLVQLFQGHSYLLAFVTTVIGLVLGYRTGSRRGNPRAHIEVGL